MMSDRCPICNRLWKDCTCLEQLPWPVPVPPDEPQPPAPPPMPPKE